MRDTRQERKAKLGIIEMLRRQGQPRVAETIWEEMPEDEPVDADMEGAEEIPSQDVEAERERRRKGKMLKGKWPVPVTGIN